MLRFQFNEKKGVEALTYVASKWPGLTAFFAAKVLFFAEKKHLNCYARPIVGDTFIAMPNGPVPSTLYDFIKGRLDQAGDPDAVMAALSIERDPYPRVAAQREPDLEVLSPSDLECLDAAIAFCQGREFGALSNLTHQERAWLSAPANGPMDYENMIDGDGPERESYRRRGEGICGLRCVVIVGHVYVIYTALARPPKDKLTVCICADDNLFFWINTDPQRHGVGQFALDANDHAALSRDCFLDCSRVTTFAEHELNDAKHRGPISAHLARRIADFLRNNPPKTLAPRFVTLAIDNLTALF